MPPRSSPTIPTRHRTRSGLTLVELAVTVALVGTLAAVALPTYRSHVEKGRIGVALRDIGEISIGLERYFTEKGTYPTSLTAAGLDKSDPWGNGYVYLNMTGAKTGLVRKDKSLHPLNTDYDLYSKGADGASASPLTAASSRDDIIRANNGGFIGKASDY